MSKDEAAPEKNGAVKAEKVDVKEEDTDREERIIRQVEYYFGDMNLPRDKFLHEQIKLDDGWVPLDVLTSFKRLANITTDTEVIAAAINNSTLGLLEVSADNKKVRRSPEMPLPEMNEERRKELAARTVYVKGFPKDAELDDCITFFKKHAQIDTVIMRRYLDRKTNQRMFKGSVFATFPTKEQAETFLETKDLKYGDESLLVRWQAEYLEDKQAEYALRKGKKHNKKDDKEEVKEKFTLPLGAVLHFTDVGENIPREKIKEALTEKGAEVAFIDFKIGEKEGWARLTKENTAQGIFEKLDDGKLKVESDELTFKVIGGDEEKAFLAKTVEDMTNRRKNINKNKYNKGNKQHRGNRFQGRKRKQEGHQEAPPAKVKT